MGGGLGHPHPAQPADGRLAIAADENQPYSPSAPIVNDRLSDLGYLKSTDGAPPVKNADSLHATAYQPPLSARLGVRLAF